MADVFISYSRVDLAVAKTLAGYLNQQGVETWRDTQLAAGDIFSNKIRSEIACAKAVIVIWSESSANSLWVRSEAQEAYDTGKLVALFSIDVEGQAATACAMA